MFTDLFEGVDGQNWRQNTIFANETHELVQIMDDGEANGSVWFLLYWEDDYVMMIEQPRAKLSLYPKVPYIARKRHGFYR